MIDRRDFLLLRTTPDQGVELSCERLFMRYVDAQADGTLPQLLDTLARDLAGASEVRLVERSWLSSAEFRDAVDEALADFVSGGGRVL